MKASLQITLALIIGLLMVAGIQTCKMKLEETDTKIIHGGLER